jgi:transcriptional regulator with XRE-family HTH domain
MYDGINWIRHILCQIVLIEGRIIMDSYSAVQPLTILQYLALIHQVTYTNVCREVGLTPQQFSDWVKKRRPVPKERLQALSAFFKVNADLLIDEGHYLRNLTPEAKIDVQILFLKQILMKEEENTEEEGYRQKLQHLQWEKRKQALITRFSTLLDQENKQMEELCVAFLDHMENESSEVLNKLLKEKRDEV